MKSWLFGEIGTSADELILEGWHKPGSLTQCSGAWIHAAGCAVLDAGAYDIAVEPHFVWLAVVSGDVRLVHADGELPLTAQDSCVLPASRGNMTLHVEGASSRVIWIALAGPLAPMVVRKLGALLHMPLRQAALPSQMVVAEQIVQVMVRHSGTANATYQLQHLMYGMIATHWGQPVSMDAMLSHEVGKVVDFMRADQYRTNLSLPEMAAISRVPTETFRKRFVSEVGMPPLSYLLHCKMERAKELLREPGCSVRQVGIEVGMQDPYHFSKQFKNIIGISPSAFMKQAMKPDATIRKQLPPKK